MHGKLGDVHLPRLDDDLVTDTSPWDPSSPRNRDRTRESKRQIRAILMEWDPIGVSGVPEAADEYDCMISPLMHQLFDGASVQSLAAWIDVQRTEHFGLARNAESDLLTATRLVRWWIERTSNT